MRHALITFALATLIAGGCASQTSSPRAPKKSEPSPVPSSTPSASVRSPSEAARLRFELAVAPAALEVTVVLRASRLSKPTFTLPWAGANAIREASASRDDGSEPRALPRDAAEWNVPECTKECRITYRIEVSAVRGRRRGFDEGTGTTTAILTTARMLLAEPTEYEPTAPVEVTWKDETRFVSGLLPMSGTKTARFIFDAWDESTFTALGDVPCRESPRKGARFCIVGNLRMADEAFGVAFARAEDGVTKFYGRVAAPALTVFAAAVPRAHEIVFGKVRAMAGPSIAFFVGERFEKEQDAKNDWVMVHELLHLGFPTLFEARWFSEGIATVFEPVIRLRMGDLDEARVWKGFADNLPRGLPALNTAGAIRESGGIDAMYWASSTLLFEWEHALRAKTSNRLGVEHALARLAQKYEGAPATHLSTLEEVVAELDAITETKTLAEAMARTEKNRHVTLHDLLAPFGVDDKGRVVDSSPEAKARRDRFLRHTE